jgi:serine/threonine-protein kinase
MLELGQVLHDKYRVDRLIGKGGMGQVFEGFHLLIERRVAIKVLLPEVASSEDGAARFEREVRAAARISNDHILDVFDAGSLADGSRFMVSEFLDGETLEARLRRNVLSARETALLLLQLLDGLAAAHRAGVAHRDLKPDNIFLTRKAGRDDFVKIIDFGVSKVVLDEHAMSMTTTGTILGTPHYLSPEQARGERAIDQRSDLYTVGVIMYRCVAGRVPFQAETIQGQLFKIALEEATPLAQIIPGLDRGFSALTQRAMAKDRTRRFQSAEEMSAALKAWLSGAETAAEAAADTLQVNASSNSENVPATTAPGPTSSNVEVTAPEVPIPRPPRQRTRTVLLGLAAIAALSAAALSTLRQSSSPAAASASAEQARPAAVPPASSTLPVTETSPSRPEPVPTEATRPSERAAPPPTVSAELDGGGMPASQASAQPAASPPPRRKPSERSHPGKPPPAVPAAEPSVPKPSATGHVRRDFGY